MCRENPRIVVFLTVLANGTHRSLDRAQHLHHNFVGGAAHSVVNYHLFGQRRTGLLLLEFDSDRDVQMTASSLPACFFILIVRS